MAEPSLAAGAKENVLIQAGACSITLLPAFGGKIASIRVCDQELLQPPLAPVAPRTRTMSFDAADASGWDECLPSVAECDVTTADGTAHIPDHGDLWRVKWHLEEGDPDTQVVTLRGNCFSLPLSLERILTLTETGEGWRLNLHYKLTNTGHVEIPWSWAAHPLFLAAPGDRISLPESVRTLRVEGSGGNRLGISGDTIHWPITKLASGGLADLSIAQPAESGIGDKLFAGPLSAEENWCSLERPQAGVRIKVSFDPGATPYLGLWICHGGWPDRPGPKQTCVAIEPATAPVDSLAVPGTWSRQLAPGASYSWAMHVDLELL